MASNRANKRLDSVPHLSSSEHVEERSGLGPGPEERVYLEGHHGAGVESQGPSVLREVGQQVLGVVEANHGNPRSHINRINIVT